MSFIDKIGDVWKAQFDTVNHGWLSGNGNDFQTG